MEQVNKTIAKEVRKLFADGRIKGFVGLRKQGQHVAPFVFTSSGQLGSFVTGDEQEPGGVRYSFFRLLGDLALRYPKDNFAVMVRGCDERALESLITDGRVASLDPRRFIKVGFSCPTELAERCFCSKPWPDALVDGAGEKTPAPTFESLSPVELLDGMSDWMKIFERCLKCHGCRNVCPVCGCKECTMEREEMVHQRQLPAPPSFLLTRAVHMVDRCVYCGLCEEACPADIPLRGIYRLVARMTGHKSYQPDRRVVPRLDKPEPESGQEPETTQAEAGEPA
jgi:formate dehydrogenase subunit beta